MKTTTLVVLGMLLVAAPSYAHGGDRGFGVFGGFGGWGLGEHHSGGLGLGFGLGFGFLDAERIQTQFENRFDSLQMQYDDGVAGNADFFTSTEYDTIVNKTERLDDRYGLFVSGVERGIDRLGDVISIVSDDVTFFNDLLTRYQADESISDARLERIEMWINRVTDRLNTKIDTLTEKQSTLETNLPTYQSFQMDISTFLSDIVAAGGGTNDGTSSSLKSLASLATTSTLAEAGSGGALAAATSMSLSQNVVPEPSLAMLALLAAGGLLTARGRRRQRV